EHGESFTVECNGKEIWARGANWIPNDSFPGIVDTRDYREQVERCIDLGFNMVRIWGGGLIGDEQFMVASDEMGLLVWHDFPYACALYPDDDEYREEARKESRTMVRKLRNHTSLVFWCGNNENQMIFESGWSRAKVPPTRLFGENIYNDVIPEVLSEEDPDRSYIPSSPWGSDKNKDTPAHWGANAGGVGNQHNWDVWHGRGDWRHYADSTTRFSSEFGFSSSCSLAVWEEWLPPESWSPTSPDVRWHDKTGKGTETYHDFIRLHYPELETLDDLVYYSQLNQRDALRFGIEHLRRSEFCNGSLVWQFNDCWPVQSWSMQDYSRCLKPLGFEMMRLYRHELISIVREKDQVQIWAVNDGLEPYTLDAQFFCTSTDSGDVLKIDPLEAKVEPGERKVIHETSIRGVPMDEGLMSVLAGDELLAWQLMGEPKHGKFGPARISASLNGGEGLTLRIEGPVVDLMVYDPEDPENVYSEAETKLRGPVMITSPFGGIYELHAEHPPKELYARSLAGYHEVRISRGAF
ncbi:MAG: hypothetical protein ACOCX1_05920, partial [Fimbriimonadaceae bacterium]